VELKDAIFARRSIRDFQTEPVPRELIKEILEAGIRAPSNSNRQPWEFLVITGESLKGLKLEIEEAMRSGRGGARELKTWDDNWEMPEDGNRRATQLMRGLVESAMKAGIKAKDFIQSNFRFFNAPCVILVLMDKGYGYGSLVSIGAAIENILLRAYDLGLGTCWMMIPLEYDYVFRKRFNIPEKKYLVSVIAVGYPSDSKVNEFRSARDSLENVVKFYD